MRAKAGCRVVRGEMGDVLVDLPGVPLPDAVRLDVRSFLGLKEVTAEGFPKLW